MPPGTKPLVVEVVALDWKWLFLYPEQGVAAVNEMAAPVDRPIQFKITSSSVMNSFVPALAGQIYAMPGMQTTLHAVINHPGEYEGLSANYSGAGFSGMRFRFHGVDQAGFDRWIAGARLGRHAGPRDLPEARTAQRAQPRSAIRQRRVRPVRRRRQPLRGNQPHVHEGRHGHRRPRRHGLPGARNLASLDAATRERIGLDGPPRQYVGAMCTSASELAM